MKRIVPSLGALAVFEAAARLGGFTRAADELGVTQAAVSRQIRALEDDFKARLFVRGHRSIQLTDAGRVLYEAVGQSFERIAEAVETVKNPTRPEVLTVATTLAFSHFWLLPHLTAFRAERPDLELKVISKDTPTDLRDGEVDVVLRFGKPPFRDGTVLVSQPEMAYPVASPDFAASLPADFDLYHLADYPLIDIDPAVPTWMTWREWFRLAGIRPPARRSGLRFNHYSDAVYAAINGEGVTLGWHRLLERPLADGRLVRLGEKAVEPGDGHHLVVSEREAQRPAVIAFVDWIERSFATSL
nr:LysR substrate-binding domain-containing protein [Acuticoccus mangrovi]